MMLNLYDNYKKLGGIFHNIENEKDLCNLFAILSEKVALEMYQISDVSVVIANNAESWFVTDQYVEKAFESYHEKADTLMNLHAL